MKSLLAIFKQPIEIWASNKSSLHNYIKTSDLIVTMKSRTYGQCFFQKRQQIYNLLFWFGSCILVYCFLGASCSLILALNRLVMSFEAMLLDPFCWLDQNRQVMQQEKLCASFQ
jgi:hypothetical protein